MSSSNASVKAEGVLALLGAYKPDEDDTITGRVRQGGVNSEPAFRLGNICVMR
ncbi:hypothetical protein ACV1BL_14010 [Serratia marcescens]